jgi:G3E family GTPase
MQAKPAWVGHLEHTEELVAMTRIACIGGFLGSGKTTAIIRAARSFVERGMRVGIITNDQGHELVDTALIRGLGFPAEEIGGGCFCCRFQDFARNAERLAEQTEAQIILAEAVGSCTDLSSTVCQRLRRYHPTQFSVAPLTVMVDPSRVREMLNDFSPFNQDVRYLFGKQLSEADHIVLTKQDLFSDNEMGILRERISELVGDIPVHTMSARTGSGVTAWLNVIEQADGEAHELELDYERYGAAEASLGWLNANFDLVSDGAFQPTDLAEALLLRIREACRKKQLGIAHLKTMIVSPEGSAWIALTGTEATPAAGEGSQMPPCREASIIVNARVCAPPQELERMVRDSVREITASRAIVSEVHHLEAFSPAPPKRPEVFAQA